MLTIKKLTLTRGEVVLLDKMDLQIGGSEIVTLFGVSGSGKSSLLNWLVGDLDPAFFAIGELWLGTRRLDTLPTEQRRVGILFQDDLLFPHLSVGHNLAFALPHHIQGTKARRQAIENALADLGLAGFHDRDPATLSGGQRARVSLMRALLAEPQALLLDEPFSRLDAVLRTQFRAYVFEQIARLSIPTLLVTHDPADVPPGGRVIDIGDWAGSPPAPSVKTRDPGQ
jgi:putative thiamine transport system ATP-binding protein